MGRGGAILTVGRPLDWNEAKPKLAYVREHGVSQFIAHYARHKEIKRDALFYGDEIEYGLFRLDAASKKPYLSLRGAEVRELLANREVEERRAIPESGKVTWHPEYGSWMVESTPARPYSGYTDDLRRVETNMRSRRARLLAALHEDEIAPTVVAFPLLGVGDSAGLGLENKGPVAASSLVPDAVINPHPRFGTLTRNIRSRRGATVDIRAPRFLDANTPPDAGDIAADAMAFGMGCCCLQVTFQCRDVEESRHVYDQLAVLAPVMMALTAACPIVSGKLQDHDVRWGLVAQSVDDRTPTERGETSGEVDPDMARGGVSPLRTSRYSAASSYICSHKQCGHHCAAAHYNDVDLEIDELAHKQLVDAGIDDLLARHIAHLFVRDPLVLFEGLVEELDDAVATDHFENLQSTNWNSVRWKPPPADASEHVGWRVELRTMEVQLTDFENAAFTVFCVLVLRVLLSFDLNIYVPMSKVHENMARAHRRDAVTQQKFWWRSHMVRPDRGACPSHQKGQPCSVHDDAGAVVEMTCLEILTGKGAYYPGLVPLVLVYLDSIGCDPDTAQRVKTYVDLIVKRASGELKTAAAWTRDFVASHPAYARDSVVPPETAYDLLQRCHDVGVGAAHEPSLLGPEPKVAPVRKENAYNVPLARVHFQTSDSLRTLLDQYAERANLVRRRSELAGDVARLKADLVRAEAELKDVDDALEPRSQGLSRPASMQRMRASSDGTLSVEILSP